MLGKTFIACFHGEIVYGYYHGKFVKIIGQRGKHVKYKIINKNDHTNKTVNNLYHPTNFQLR